MIHFSAPKIVVRDKTRVVWSPAKPELNSAISPARLPPLDGDKSQPEVLRLLSSPLYRYELKDSQGTSPILRDGAMFAFVMGTDPEAVLLLEAVEREGKAVWQYALARATAYPVEASLGDEVIWSVQGGPHPTNLMQISRPIPR